MNLVYQPGARELRANLTHWLPTTANTNWQLTTQTLVDLAQSAQTGLEQAARAYFGVDAELGLTAWRAEINRLPTETLWQTQARDDVYSIASQITQGLLSRSGGLAEWSEQHGTAIERLRKLLQNISRQSPDLAPVSVALRELRHLA